MSDDHAACCPQCGHELAEGKYCPACQWPLSPSADGPGGDLVGQLCEERYHVLRQLGAGGMAEVYLVEHIRMGKRMAMKVLRPQDVPSDQESWVRKRFTAEARAVSHLTSAHTVAVFDFGTLKDGMLYLVMEFVRGESLREHLNKVSVFSEIEAAHIGEQALDSLGEAHRQGIIHRDIKPDNLMMAQSTEGNLLAKVLDFGVARTLRGDRVLREALEREEAGLVVGTPDYVSPEQAAGESVGPVSDIYSLGSTLFELVTGAPPFPEPTPNDVLLAIMDAKKPPVPVRGDGVPIEPGFVAILAKAMAHKISDRYADAAEMRAALREYLRQHDTAAAGLSGDALAGLPLAVLEPLVEGEDVAGELASRADFEAFERHLQRRNQYRLLALLLVSLIAGGVFAWYHLGSGNPPPSADAREREPNNRPSQANRVAFPGEFQGHLGKRVSRELADRDWVRFEVPERQVARIALTPIPNMDLELAVYPGDPDADGQHAAVALGNDRERGEGEVLPNLTLDPGPYYVRITEHRPAGVDYYPSENVSDQYRLLVEGRHQAVDEEVEPNEARERASPLTLGGTMRGLAVCADDRDWYAVDLGSAGRRTVDLAISGLTGAARQLLVYGEDAKPLYRFDLTGKLEYRRNKLRLGKQPLTQLFVEVLGPPAGGAAERWYELTVR